MNTKPSNTFARDVPTSGILLLPNCWVKIEFSNICRPGALYSCPLLRSVFSWTVSPELTSKLPGKYQTPSSWVPGVLLPCFLVQQYSYRPELAHTVLERVICSAPLTPGLALASVVETYLCQRCTRPRRLCFHSSVPITHPAPAKLCKSFHRL